MASRRAQINAGAAVSSLEGRARLLFRGDDIENHTLSGINTRVRVLESYYDITPPPPNLDPTWESLAWRICHLNDKPNKCRRNTSDNIFLSLLPDDVEVSVETLQTICSELGKNRMPAAYEHAPWPKCVEDEEMLDIIRQRMCFEAGRNGVEIKVMPITRMEIYAELVALDMKTVPAGFPRHPGMRPPPGALNMYPSWANKEDKKKDCCGCCSCDCHKDNSGGSDSGSESGTGSDSGSDVSSVVSTRRKRFFGFGWLRKLFCLRPKVDDDRASISTRSSLTAV